MYPTFYGSFVARYYTENQDDQDIFQECCHTIGIQPENPQTLGLLEGAWQKNDDFPQMLANKLVMEQCVSSAQTPYPGIFAMGGIPAKLPQGLVGNLLDFNICEWATCRMGKGTHAMLALTNADPTLDLGMLFHLLGRAIPDVQVGLVQVEVTDIILNETRIARDGKGSRILAA